MVAVLLDLVEDSAAEHVPGVVVLVRGDLPRAVVDEVPPVVLSWGVFFELELAHDHVVVPVVNSFRLVF